MAHLLLLTSVVLFMCSELSIGGRSSWGCGYGDKWYRRGREFKPSPCLYCRCDEGNIVVCSKTICITPPCYDSVKLEGYCCAYCPNGPNCRLSDDRVLRDGEQVDEGDNICTCDATAEGGPSVKCRPKGIYAEFDNDWPL